MPTVRRLRTVTGTVALVLLTLGLGWPFEARPAGALAIDIEDPWWFCAREIDHAERTQGIPDRLLRAIAQVESGRWNDGAQAILAWPWTVMAEGRGRYLPTKEAAIAEVRALRARGVRNIDVGCMQVNLHYHPDAFATLAEAFDPTRNVAYAAQFLARLKMKKRSWVKAVAHYHSATPALHRVYRAKVYEAWRAERRRTLRDRGSAGLRAPASQRVTRF